MKNLILFLAKLTCSNATRSTLTITFSLSVALLAGSIGYAPQAYAADEEYYTWVDENGVTNYAERNPEGVRATFVGRNQAFGRRAAESQDSQDNQGRPQGPDALPSSQPSEIDPDALVDENAAVLAAEVAATKSRNCEIGKSNLAQLKAFARIRVADESGNERIMTDEEKEAKANEARQIIRDNCSG